jgi:hypothetical protein
MVWLCGDSGGGVCGGGGSDARVETQQSASLRAHLYDTLIVCSSKIIYFGMVIWYDKLQEVNCVVFIIYNEEEICSFSR